MRFAIIGSGLAGLSLASRLSRAHKVTVFEKARGPGGRMSTRRADPYAFDHGAQYFTQTSEAFGAFLAPFLDQGLIQKWPTHIGPQSFERESGKTRYVGVPGMNAICKHLAAELDVKPGHRIERLVRERDHWHLIDDRGRAHGPFDWVISSAPAPQTALLLPQAFSGQEKLAKIEMQGCFALMLGFGTPIDLDWQAFRPESSPVGWMAVNSSKPDRPAAFALLVHSTNVWAEQHLESPKEEVEQMLLDAASEIVGVDLSVASHRSLHLWRYAATSTPLGAPFLIDEALKLAACGDWCLGSKVEAAFESADALSRVFA